MSKNQAVREELERIYGSICMLHQGLHINGYKKTKTNYKGKAIASQLTFHHIKPKSQGGKATIENGAVLCRACHDYLEQSSPQGKAELNRKLQEYKRAKLDFVEEIDLPFEVVTTDLQVEPKMSKKEKKRILRKQRKKEKKEMQKLRKEWEDR